MIDLTRFEGHTRGPWGIWNNTDIYPWGPKHADGKRHIAVADMENAPLVPDEANAVTLLTYPECKANARLIAAAPALLEENRMLRQMLLQTAPIEAFRSHGNVYCHVQTQPEEVYDLIQKTVQEIMEAAENG